MQIAILAGGLATRLYPVTKSIPKSMIEINHKPFLAHQLDLLKKSGIRNIVLCVGSLKEQIKDYFGDGSNLGVSIRYSEEDKTLLGCAGALKNAEHLLEDEFFAMYGDSYLLFDYKRIEEYFRKTGKLALMVVYKNYHQYDRSNVVIEDNLIKIYDKTSQTDDMVYIDAGLLAMKKQILLQLHPGVNMSFDDMLKDLIKQKQAAAFETKQRFYEIGSKKGLKEFRQFMGEFISDSN